MVVTHTVHRTHGLHSNSVFVVWHHMRTTYLPMDLEGLPMALPSRIVSIPLRPDAEVSSFGVQMGVQLSQPGYEFGNVCIVQS